MEIAVTVLLALAALAAVAYPLVRPAPEPGEAAAAGRDDAAIEREVARYRAAIRAGTSCPRCYTANPEGSRFCAGCGAPLGPDADADRPAERPEAAPAGRSAAG